jgi:hypothetical protein
MATTPETPAPAPAPRPPGAAAHVTRMAAARAARAFSPLPSLSATAAAEMTATAADAAPVVRDTRPMLAPRVTLKMPLLLLLLCVVQGPRATIAAPPTDLSNYQSRHACPVGPATALPSPPRNASAVPKAAVPASSHRRLRRRRRRHRRHRHRCRCRCRPLLPRFTIRKTFAAAGFSRNLCT